MKSTKQFENCNNFKNKSLFYSENNNLIEVIENIISSHRKLKFLFIQTNQFSCFSKDCEFTNE